MDQRQTAVISVDLGAGDLVTQAGGSQVVTSACRDAARPLPKPKTTLAQSTCDDGESPSSECRWRSRHVSSVNQTHSPHSNYTIRSTTVARADFLTGVLLRVCTETSHYAHTAYYSYNHTQTTIMALFLELPAPCGSWVCKWVSVYVSK